MNLPVSGKRGWVWLVAIVVMLVLSVFAWWYFRVATVNVVTLKRSPLVRTLQFSARVASLARVDVGSTLTGRVGRVLVTEGAHVRKDEPLIELEADELRAALAQARAAEQQAQARVVGIRSTGRLSVEAGVAQAQAVLRSAEKELARTRELVDQGFLSTSRLDDSLRTVDVAKAQRDAALAQAQANKDLGSDTVQAQAQLAASRAATVAARARLDQATLVAPADARVLSRSVEPGQIVQPGKPLISLALAGATQLAAQVDERFLNQLVPGQRATVVADAFPSQRFAARVLTIAPAIDAQRGAVEVKFAPEQQTPPFLREDMTLSVEVVTAQRDNALVLPLGALQSEADGVASAPSADMSAGSSATVMLVKEGHTVKRTVRLGLRTLAAAEVLQGLEEGDVVVTGTNVASGVRVRTQAVAWQASGPVVSGASRTDAGAALTNAMGR